jgi:hypothetical protein
MVAIKEAIAIPVGKHIISILVMPVGLGFATIHAVDMRPRRGAMVPNHSSIIEVAIGIVDHHVSVGATEPERIHGHPSQAGVGPCDACRRNLIISK